MDWNLATPISVALKASDREGFATAIVELHVGPERAHLKPTLLRIEMELDAPDAAMMMTVRDLAEDTCLRLARELHAALALRRPDLPPEAQ